MYVQGEMKKRLRPWRLMNVWRRLVQAQLLRGSGQWGPLPPAISMDPLKKVMLIPSSKKKEMHVWGHQEQVLGEGCSKGNHWRGVVDSELCPYRWAWLTYWGIPIDVCGIQGSTCKKLCGLCLLLQWSVLRHPS